VGLLIDLVGVGGPPVDPPLPDQPSIVVLPFDNMSEDPEQEYLADGITEDLTTELSRTAALFVIARNSAFTYKGRAVVVEDVGRELGVRYVVEGSVRRDADRIRVTAQLIDATSGFHLWGERYDDEIADLFSVQSELAEQIMGAVGIEVRAAEIERIRRKPTESLTARDLYMRALHQYMKFTREGHESARQLLERTIELDPQYATAHATLGGIYLNEYYCLWSLDPGLLDRTIEKADRALAIDGSNPTALVNKAAALMASGRSAEALAYGERAVALDPNWDVPHTILAFARVLTGDPLGALRSTRRALRRNPKVSGGDLMAIADINYLAGRTEVARGLYEQIRASNPDLISARLQLAVMYESQGRRDEAMLLVQESLRVNPDLTTDLLAEAGLTAAFRIADDKSKVRDSLQRAGLP
jgi:adenylate cyclase